MTDAAPDLDVLVESARIAHAQRRSMDAAGAEVLRLLAEADGALPLDNLLAAGAPRDVVAFLVAENATDKRRKQKARLGFIGGAPVVWLSSTGWQATGKSSGRESIPSADSIAHATAPAAIGRWLQQRAGTLATHGITMRTAQGSACRRWSAEVTARAWAALRTTGDADGALGSLTGGLIPDGLVMESFPLGEAGAALHDRLRGGAPVDDDDLAETTYTLEVETSVKATRSVRRWTATRPPANSSTPPGPSSGSSTRAPSQTDCGISASMTPDARLRSSCLPGIWDSAERTWDRCGGPGG